MSDMQQVMAGVNIPRPKNLLPEEPEPERCGTCHGAQYLRHNVDVLDPRFGSIYPCPDCKEGEIRHQRIAKLVGQSGLDRHQHMSFDRLTPSAQQRAAWDAAIAWVSTDEPETPFLWMHGPPGTGKTTIAVCMANLLMSRDRPVIYRTASRLVDALFAALNNPDGSNLEAVMQLALDRRIVLVIDELGRSSDKGFAGEKLYSILDQRLFEQSPTIVATNKTPEELPPALQSRVLSAQVTLIRVQ